VQLSVEATTRQEMPVPTRFALSLAACAAAAALAAGSAGAQSPTDNPVPGALPGACADSVAPVSGFTRRAARRAGRRRVLRGVARDIGCGVDRVTISVARKRHGLCRHLTPRRRLTHRRVSCAHRRWLPVRGSSRWSFRLPRRLHRGTYVVRTRAIDFAGNVERTHKRRLKLRRRAVR
jgi:hypothetical protein